MDTCWAAAHCLANVPLARCEKKQPHLVFACGAGHWNVAGRWEDLWADQSPFRVGIDAYLAAGNTSAKHRSLEDIYRCCSL